MAGAAGAAGATGPQGPGAATIDATLPEGTSTPTRIGSVGAMTLYSECTSALVNNGQVMPYTSYEVSLYTTLPGGGWTIAGAVTPENVDQISTGTGGATVAAPPQPVLASAVTATTPYEVVSISTSTPEEQSYELHIVDGSSGYNVSLDAQVGTSSQCAFAGDIVPSS